MAPSIFFLSIILILIIYVSLIAQILFFLKKLFKFGNPSFKKSIIMALAYIGTIAIVRYILRSIIGITLPEVFIYFLASALSFYFFYLLLNKYYKSNLISSLKLFIIFVLIAGAFQFSYVAVIRSHIDPFVVSGDAMNPSLKNGDYLLIQKFGKDFSRADIIVFKHRDNGKEVSIIERIIGLPGEKIDIEGGDIFINDSLLKEEYLNSNIKTEGDISLTLSNNQYLVLGDNRNKSFDSRTFGPIFSENIVGKVLYKVFSSD